MEASQINTLCAFFVDFNGVYPLAVALIDVGILFENRDEFFLIDVLHGCYLGRDNVEERARLDEECSHSYYSPLR